jgi:hypothetical protein
MMLSHSCASNFYAVLLDVPFGIMTVSEDPCAVLDPLNQAAEDLQVLEVS